MKISVQHAGIWILRAQTKGAAKALTRLKDPGLLRQNVFVSEVVLEGHRELEGWIPALVSMGCHFVKASDNAPIEYVDGTFIYKEEPLVTIAKRAMGRR